jgi:uncharacterized protein YjbI with pentapeptide repeats
MWLRDEEGGECANLTGANLRGAELACAYLRGADLRGANLRGADLTGANLRGADLTDADLRDANLYGANLTGADLRDADLTGAYLESADLRYADLRDATYGEGIEIGQNPKQILGGYFSVFVFKTHIKIGCEIKTLSQWRKTTIKAIAAEHGKQAGKEWRIWKKALLDMAETHMKEAAKCKVEA